MTKIVAFPSREAQGLAFLETELRKMLSDQGEAEPVIDIAIQTLKQVYQSYGDLGQKSFEVRLPASLTDAQNEQIRQQIETGIEQLNEGHRHILNRLAAELVLTKIALIKLQGQNDEGK